MEYNDWNHTCYGLWSNDGLTPPPYLGRTFDASHTHYLTSGSTVIDSQDIEVMLKHVTQHGYGTARGSQMSIFAHPDDVDAATRRPGEPGWSTEAVDLSLCTTSSRVPLCPRGSAMNRSTVLSPAADFNGLQVRGSYAGALLIQSNFVPVGYVAVVASGGPNSDLNLWPSANTRTWITKACAIFRAHWNGYPLQDSFFARGFGVGVRHRGAAVVCKITTGSYSAPVIRR